MKYAVIAALGLVGSLAAAAPAYAAESPDCIPQNTNPAVLKGFEDRVAAGLIANDDTVLNQDWSPLRAAVDACGAKYRWSEKARSLASQMALANIMKGAVVRALANDKLDPVVLASMYRDLPIDVRRQFRDQSTINAAATVFAQRMAARGIVTDGNGNKHIGMLLAALALLEFCSAEFATA